MKRNTIGKYARQIVREMSDLWSTQPRLSAHKTRAHHGDRIDEAQQAQGFPAGAPQTQEHVAKPGNDQRAAALSTWEDEGGRTAGPAKAVGVQQGARLE